MSSLVIHVKSPKIASQLSAELARASGKDGCHALSRYFASLAGGTELGEVDIFTDDSDPVRASQTFTFASVVQDEALSVAGITFTAKNSPSGAVEFDVGVSDTETAANAAAAINAHTTAGKLVLATSSAAVLTLTAHEPGLLGNQVPVTETGTTITIGGSGTNLEGGQGGCESASEQTYNQGHT